MIESRCGILCESCSYRKEGGCGGCTRIDKPFWGDSCPLKSCCEEKRLDHCGQCAAFPCQQLTDFAYDQEHGDEGRRLGQCRKWMEP